MIKFIVGVAVGGYIVSMNSNIVEDTIRFICNLC